MRDIIEEIWASVRRNKLRTALTGFAVAWGIFMLIFLLGAGNGIIHAIEFNMGRFLDNSMMIFPGSTSKPFRGYKEGREIDLKDKDFNTTAEKFESNIIELGANLNQNNVSITYGENYISASLSGVYPNDIKINKRKMLYGRFINEEDMKQSRKVLIVDYLNAKELMPHDASRLIGKYVKVDQLAFQVVGIYKTEMSQMTNSQIVPFTTLRTIYNRGDDIERIEFSFKGLRTMKENEDFEKNYKAALNANHIAAPDDESTIGIWNRFTQSMQMNTGLGIVRIALWVIGVFTLLSGIVGVSNIMLVSVKERTREFGIRKAIGAKPSHILWLIIVESIIITTFFGFIGMLAGIGANAYIDASAGQMNMDAGNVSQVVFLNPTVGLDVCLQSLVVMIVSGCVAGLVPARKAAKIRPIEALRAE